jgi:hypothetical protein
MNLININSKESAKRIRDVWMNEHPSLMFLEKPNEMFPGRFVVVFREDNMTATLTRIEKEF